MAKIYGLNGVLSGRQGSTVFAVRNGVNIARKYQPVVSNPKSNAQVASRAKLKALSQLSALLGRAIVIPKQGDVSSRNMFTKLNYPAASYANDAASIDMAAVKLTAGLTAMPSIESTGHGSGHVSVGLATAPSTAFDRVMYVVMDIRPNGTIDGSRVISQNVPGENNTYTAQIPLLDINAAHIYAYGIRILDASYRVRYESLEDNGINAILDVIRSASSEVLSISQTSYVRIPPKVSANAKDDEGIESRSKKK